MKKKIVIGLMGTIGSGKTTASSFFPKSWKIINVDARGHSLLKKIEIKKRILKIFGKKILDQTNHKISRKKLATIVFQNKKKLQDLNKIMHPLLKKEVMKEIAKSLRIQKHVVIDCALLVPLGLAKKCMYIIQIQAPKKILSQRLRKKYTRKQQQFVMREQQTTPSPDFIVVNDGTKKELKNQIRKIITFLYAA